MFYNIILFFFYVWAVPAILFEIWMMSKKNYDRIIFYNEKTTKEENKAKNYFVKSKAEQLSGPECAFSLLVLGYFLWDTVGLFSSQWVFFLALWILSLISIGIRKIKSMNYAWNVIDSILSIIILFSIIINKYHIHYHAKDIWKGIVHLFT